MTFDKVYLEVLPFVLNSEGGYSNHPNDPGGPTMRGIAWNYNAGWLQAHGYTRETLKKLTKEHAALCYYERYWIPSGAIGITDVDLAYIHMDTAVNCGVGTAIKMLKRLSHNPGYYDFSGGKNRALALSLFLEYAAQRIRYYTQAKNRDKFLAGWMNRMASVIENSLGLD